MDGHDGPPSVAALCRRPAAGAVEDTQDDDVFRNGIDDDERRRRDDEFARPSRPTRPAGQRKITQPLHLPLDLVPEIERRRWTVVGDVG